MPLSKSAPSAESANPTSDPEVFVVALGASAGGLDAISELLKNIPASSGLAFIIVQHLDPTHASMLVELLARISSLPVSWAEHGASVAAGHVYIVPADAYLKIENG